MKTHFIAFAVVALMGLGVMGYAVLDGSVTGKGVDISRIRPEIVKKTVEQIDTSKPIVQLPPEKLKRVYAVTPTYQEPYQAPKCDCPNPYEGHILTYQEGGIMVGLKRIDCTLWWEILQIKNEIGKPHKGPDILQDMCKVRGWWHGS